MDMEELGLLGVERAALGAVAQGLAEGRGPGWAQLMLTLGLQALQDGVRQAEDLVRASAH